MKLSTTDLVLAADAAIDLQTHTHYSDGVWTPEGLIDYAAREQFGLLAITDHDRIDTLAALQEMALARRFPLLVAVEMSTVWKDEPMDVLCYGFDPEQNALGALAQDVLRRQQENTRAAYLSLVQQGYKFSQSPEGEAQTIELTALLEKPSAQHPHALVALLKKYGYGSEALPVGKILRSVGVQFETNDLVPIVEAAHHSGAVCLVAHPGRADGFAFFDLNALDELRQTVPIDGIEVYYPAHTAEQSAAYLDYARQHHWLTSSGSDSHGPEKTPIKYRAELSRDLLERVGVRVK